MSDQTALITGASSGIGEAFARQLAARQYDLLLVARRQERLTALATELHERHGIVVEPLVADLINPADVERVADRVAQTETLAMLINNAGFGTTGRFARIDVNRQLEMIQLHVMAPVRLTRAALPGMIARHRGTIINTASTIAFFPFPGNAVYSATKAFLLAFTKGLQVELTGSGVQVQALCPGFTYSGFHDTAEYAHFKRSQLPQFLWMSATEVVEESLRAVERKQVICIPGFKNRLQVAIATHPLGWKLLFSLLFRRR